MNIRKLAIDDYDGVLALWLSCTGMGLNDVDDSLTGLARFLSRNPETCFAAFNEGIIVGVILLGDDGRRGYIYHLAVSPHERGKGFGRRLVEEALSAAEKLGITKVECVVFQRNEAGNQFWEHLGFTARPDLVFRNRSLRSVTRTDT